MKYIAVFENVSTEYIGCWHVIIINYKRSTRYQSEKYLNTLLQLSRCARVCVRVENNFFVVKINYISSMDGYIQNSHFHSCYLYTT